MYFKITNKESEIYKRLHEQRTKEIDAENENRKIVEQKVVYPFTEFLGHHGQQNFRRVTIYSGFKFDLDETNINPKIWRRDSEVKSCFVPNRRFKLGREISDLLSNGLNGFRFDIIFEIFGIEHPKTFKFPFMEICPDGDLVVYFGEDYDFNSPDITEITKTEFNGKLAFK